MNNPVANNPVAVSLKALKTPAVYMVVLVLALIMLFDFAKRVWQPLQVRDTNLAELTVADLFPQQELARPEALAAWLQQLEQEQQQGAGKEGQQHEQKEVQALPGSTVIDSENIRIRAIFVTAGNNQQALAIAELQHRESGNISRVVWRVGDLISAWRVQRIEPQRVMLQRQAQTDQATEQAQEHIELYVFEPSQLKAAVLEVDSESK